MVLSPLGSGVVSRGYLDTYVFLVLTEPYSKMFAMT